MPTHQTSYLCVLILALAALAVPGSAQCPVSYYSVYGDSAGANMGSTTGIATIDDVDGDGVPDFVAGVCCDDTVASNAGLVRMFSGASGLMIWEVFGSSAGELFGSAVTTIADVSGDAIPDVIVGAYGGNGAVHVLSGTTGGSIHSATGDSAGDELGFAVVGLDDINGDTIPDYLASAPGWNGDDGYLRFYSGLDGAELATQFQAPGSGRRYGHSLANIGDINNDTKSDYALGAPLYDGFGGADTGFIQVLSGDSTAPLILHFVFGDGANDKLGGSVCGLGDVDGDLVPDFAGGAEDGGVNANGYVRVYSGGVVNTAIRTITGPLPYDAIGWSVANAGDVSSDGVPDMLVGSPFHNVAGNPNIWDQGAAWVISGADGSQLAEFLGTTHREQLGMSLAGNADFNGDGRPDLLIGTQNHNGPGGVNTGRIEMWSLPFAPGTCGADVLMETGVNAVPTIADSQVAQAFDTLGVRISSPGGSLYGAPIIFAAQIFTTGNVVLGTPGVADIQLNFLVSPGPLFLAGDVGTPLGFVALVPGGNTFGFLLPPGLSGQTIILQALAFTFAAPPALPYVATHAHEVRMN